MGDGYKIDSMAKQKEVLSILISYEARLANVPDM